MQTSYIIEAWTNRNGGKEMSLFCSFMPVALLEWIVSRDFWKNPRQFLFRAQVFLFAFLSFLPLHLCYSSLQRRHANVRTPQRGRLCVCETGEMYAPRCFISNVKSKITELGMPFFFSHIWGQTLLYFLLIKKNRRGQRWTGGDGGGRAGGRFCVLLIKKTKNIVKERKKNELKCFLKLLCNT